MSRSGRKEDFLTLLREKRELMLLRANARSSIREARLSLPKFGLESWYENVLHQACLWRNESRGIPKFGTTSGNFITVQLVSE